MTAPDAPVARATTAWAELDQLARLKRLADSVGGPLDLARLADVPRSTLYRWLSGQSQPPPAKLQRIERQMGLEPGELTDAPGVEELRGRAPHPPDRPIAVDVPAFEPIDPPAGGWSAAEPVERLFYPVEAVRGLDPAGPLIAIRAVGEALAPKVADGEWAVVDTGDKRIVTGRLYCVSLAGRVLLRRVLDEPSGLILAGLRAPPDPIQVAHGDAELIIHGRIVLAQPPARLVK